MARFAVGSSSPCVHPIQFRSNAKWLLKIVGLAILVPLSAFAADIDQPNAGILQPFSTIETHEYDSINLATLAIQLNVPVRVKAGHIQFSYVLKGSSQIRWMTSVRPDGTERYWFNGIPGLSGEEEHAQDRGVAYASTFSKSCDGGPQTRYDAWTFTDESGTHPVGISGLWTDAVCGVTSDSAYTTDGSGIYVFITTSPFRSGYAIYPNGDKATFALNLLTGSFTDPDNNAITFTASQNGTARDFTFKDTLSTTATALSVHTDTATNPAETVTWKDALNNDQQEKYYTATKSLLSAFGCGQDNTDPVATQFPDHVSLPDSSTITYGWEKNVNNVDYTGRIASITLPTTGQVTYHYSGGNNGLNCVDATNNTVTRTTLDGTWIYVHTPPPTRNGFPTTTQVTDPAGNVTVYTFTMATASTGADTDIFVPLETKKVVNNGSSTLIQAVYTCYNNSASTPTDSCSQNPLKYPITEKDEYTLYPNKTGYAGVKAIYDLNGLVTSVKMYDYSSTTTPVSQQSIDYGKGSPSSQSCTAIGNNIIGKPCHVVVRDSANAIMTETWNTYDAHGNLTQTWSLVSGSGATGTYLTKQYSYTNGVVQTSTDVNGQMMNYTTSSCNSMFVTSQVPTGFSSLVTSQVWDCVGGVVKSQTDANAQITKTNYVNASNVADDFYRPMETVDARNNVTSLTYTTTGMDSSLPVNSGASVIQSHMTTDTIGRAVTTQLKLGPTSTNWETKTRSFDSAGRRLQTSLGCVKTQGVPCSASGESQTYDGLNRPLIHTGAGGDIVQKSYYGNDVLTILTPIPTGEHQKQVQKEYDGLGRLTSACLISGAGGNGACGQTTPNKNGFLTQYFYDGAGRLTKTVENAQSANTQTRTYIYDQVGRVTSETNPESGTMAYTYDTVNVAGCVSTSAGDLVKKQDANGSISCYHYDGLHRNTYITYSGTNSTGVNKFLVYDAATVNTVAMANAKGRLAEVYTCAGTAPPCTPKITDEGFSYDVRGQLADYYQSSPNSGGYYHLQVSARWEDGQIKTLSGVGLPTITYTGLDGAARVTQVNASIGANPVTAVTYNDTDTMQPIGALTNVTLGAGDTQTYTYDLNTERMTKYAATVGATPVTISGTLTWNTNGTLLKNTIADGYNASDNQTCVYVYDDFVRVASSTCKNGSGAVIWGVSYGYDGFGNITRTGSGTTWSPTYFLTNNHYSNAGVAYDADGNLTNDTFHAYTWLPDGHVASIDTATITYDALGNKVEETVGGVTHEYVSQFGVNAQMTGQTQNSATVDLPGGVQALYAGTGLVRFRFPDWQGSIRAESGNSTISPRVFTESVAFDPFGERYALVGAPYNVDSFTGKPDQIVSDEYDFPARQQHNGQGRWISPDPAPGTGNKYVYADNNPLSYVDPYGLYTYQSPPNSDLLAWFASELDRPDPLIESESGSHRVQTTAVSTSMAAYLTRVNLAFEQAYEESPTPPILQRAVATESQAQGQPAQNKSVTAAYDPNKPLYTPHGVVYGNPRDPSNPGSALYDNPIVQHASDAAWVKTVNGTARGGLAEAGFEVEYRDGKISIANWRDSVNGDGKPNALTFPPDADAIAIMHVHGNGALATPSPGDRNPTTLIPDFVRSQRAVYVTIPNSGTPLNDYVQVQ